MVANTIEAIQTSKLNPVNPTEPGTLLLSSRLPHNQIMFEHGVMFWTKGTGTDKNGKPVTAVIPDSTDLERDPNAKPQITRDNEEKKTDSGSKQPAKIA